MNFGVALFLALRGSSPELPHRFDQSLLVFQTWGFLVPFVWGFSAKWLPVFLGLRPVRGRRLLWAIGLNSFGVLTSPFSIKVTVVLLSLESPLRFMPYACTSLRNGRRR